jgi:hypothetical protein
MSSLRSSPKATCALLVSKEHPQHPLYGIYSKALTETHGQR